jgi:O-antigen/teichoic acid export membrane protein
MAAAVWCFADAERILSLFYDNHLQQAAATFQWQMLAAVCFSMQYVFGTLLTADGQLRPLIRIAMAGVVYNVILNLWYIPLFGSSGAAMACFLTQALILGLQVYIVFVKYRLQGMTQLSVRMAIFAGLLVLGAYLFKMQTIIQDQIALEGALFGLYALVIALLTGLIDWRAGQQMLKAKV